MKSRRGVKFIWRFQHVRTVALTYLGANRYSGSDVRKIDLEAHSACLTILEHQIFRFAKMILRDRCSTSNDLASLFRARQGTLDFRQMEWRNYKTHWYETIRSALNFPSQKEVSQNCFVFDVVNLKI